MRKLISLILILAALVSGGIGVAQEGKQKPKLPPNLEKQAKQKSTQNALEKLAAKGERVKASAEAKARDCSCGWYGRSVCCVCNVGGAVGWGCASALVSKLPPNLEKQAEQKAMQIALRKLAAKGERVNASVEARRNCNCQIWSGSSGNGVCCTCYVGGASGTGCAWQ